MEIPRAYIACLASYNNGKLHGDWIDLDSSEEIAERIQEILMNSPEPDAEEWAVHDHENCGNLSMFAGLTELEDIQAAYKQAQEYGIEWSGYVGFCEHLGEELNTDSIAAYQERYAGSDRSLPDWCEQFLEETGQLESLPENLRFYFNYEAFARDLEISDVFTVEHGGEVLVFWNH